MMTMMMTTTEVQEDEAVLCKDQLQQIIKGKRTKRPRPVSPPLTLAMASSTTTTSSDQASGSTTFAEEEEEDVAYCLMLLAQGHRQTSKPTGPAGSDSLYVHQCKTCDRSFPSFQALSGHRASHKKPKQGDDHHQHMNTTLSLRITHKAAPPSVLCNNNNNKSNKSKVHGCSICGAEFSSGQALGGHMRRHRTTTTTTEDHLSKKPRTVLELDLNLPAPEDNDHHHHKEKKLLVFSSSNSLVDCHY